MPTPASNTFRPSTIVSRFAAKALRNNAQTHNRLRNDNVDAYRVSGYKSGETVKIKLPPRYVSATGATISKNNTVESTVDLTLVQRNIGIGVTSLPATVTINSMMEFLDPIMAQLATDWEKSLLETLYFGAENLVTPGAISSTTGPAAFTGADVSTRAVLGQAKARLTEKAFPDDGQRFGMLTPSAQAALADANAALFNPVAQLSDQYKKGLIGEYSGIKWSESAVLPRHTNGTRTNVTPLIDGTQTGASLLLKGAGNAVTINRGDQFVIAGVNAINPVTRVSTGKLQVFTVTANATASAGGAVTVAVTPSINVTSPGQTVSASAAGDATVTWMGAASVATDVNLAWHKEAGASIMFPLAKVKDSYVFTDADSGMSVRVVEVPYDGENDEEVMRVDLLAGAAVIRGAGIVRLQA